MSQRSVRLPATCSDAAREGGAGHWFGLDRVRVYSAALLILFAAFFFCWGWVTNGFADASTSRPGTDFSVFWSASHLALTHGPLQAYDLDRLTAVIAEHGTLGRGNALVLPWLYPPTFLLVVLPLALLPLGLSYVLFLLGTGYVYFRSIATLVKVKHPWRQGIWLPVLASPATFIVVLSGQNALLTAGVAAAAVSCAEKRPVLSGALIGLLAIKPQLAVLFPLALVVSRAWKTLISALLSATLFVVVSVLVCGWQTIPAFLANARWVQAHYIENGAGEWWGMPTPMAAAQMAGAGTSAAYALQLLAALGAACAMVYVWRRTAAFELRTAALAVATLLATPYLRDYELTWLGIAIAGLVGDGVRHGLTGSERALLVLAWLLPLFERVNPFLKLPQIGPVVLIAVMLLIVARAARRV